MTQMPQDVRTAIQDVMAEYAYAVDALSDIDNLLNLFTDDAQVDMTAIGLPMMYGRDEIKKFFDTVFETMSHHFHFMSNYRPESWDGTVGAMTSYVIGMGRANDGNTVTVQVKYRMECLEQDGTWKCRHYTITPMMPLPGSLTEIHGEA